MALFGEQSRWKPLMSFGIEKNCLLSTSRLAPDQATLDWQNGPHTAHTQLVHRKTNPECRQPTILEVNLLLCGVVWVV